MRTRSKHHPNQISRDTRMAYMFAAIASNTRESSVMTTSINNYRDSLWWSANPKEDIVGTLSTEQWLSLFRENSSTVFTVISS